MIFLPLDGRDRRQLTIFVRRALRSDEWSVSDRRPGGSCRHLRTSSAASCRVGRSSSCFVGWILQDSSAPAVCPTGVLCDEPLIGPVFRDSGATGAFSPRSHSLPLFPTLGFNAGCSALNCLFGAQRVSHEDWGPVVRRPTQNAEPRREVSATLVVSGEPPLPCMPVPQYSRRGDHSPLGEIAYLGGGED